MMKWLCAIFDFFRPIPACGYCGLLHVEAEDIRCSCAVGGHEISKVYEPPSYAPITEALGLPGAQSAPPRSERERRYEHALIRIADGKNFGSPLQAIAAKALGRTKPED